MMEPPNIGHCNHPAKVLTRKGTSKILGAAIVHMHAGELLAELTIAKKYELSLTKLASAIHVFPTLSEVHRSLGDVYLLQRTTPRLRKFLSPVFAWLRRGIRLKGEGPWLSLTPMD
jgi:Pyridine nucleotide-disulphide oxidoreductase, dimerisation domain